MRLVYLTLGWAAGIICAQVLSVSAWLVFVAAAVLALWRLPKATRGAFCVLLLFALGGLRMSVYPATSAVASFNHTGGLTIIGVVEGDPDLRDDRALVRVAVEQVQRGGDFYAAEGVVLVQVPRAGVAVRYGDRVRSTGILVTPGEYDTFSYADYLARSGVFSLMRHAALEVESGGHGNPFIMALYGVRQQAMAAIGRHLPEPQAGLLSGILLGNERGISPELGDAFNAVGATHVIAISGFNMAIIAGVVTAFFNRIFSRRWVAGFAALTVIAIYTLLVGANAAVVRAAVMSGLVVVGAASRRKTYVPASLAFAALLMSALNPSVLWDISFQLSFFATLGLALFADPFKAAMDAALARLFPLEWARRIGDFLTEPFVVTLAALVFTLPLSVMYFQRLSLLVLPVNLLIVPVQTALLLSGGVATVCALILPPVAPLIFWFCMVLLSWTISIVRLFATLPFANVAFSLDARMVWSVIALVLGWAMIKSVQPEWWLTLERWVRRRSTLTATVSVSLLLVALMVGLVVARPDGQLHVWFLEVGHSNGVLIQTPSGAQILVDGGNFPSRLLTALGDRLPFNDRTLEAVFITQPDEFQYGALPAVLARYETGVILTNGQPNLSPAYAELQAAMAGRTVQAVTAGYRLELDDGVSVEVLHPQAMPSLSDPLSDGALVLRVTYGDVSFLLTGQLNADGQAALLDAGAYPLATVLQLPQHGTARGLDHDFLAAVQPSLVVLQSDKANLRDDPHPDTLALVDHLPLLRTDQQGAVHVWTDGRELWAVPSRW